MNRNQAIFAAARQLQQSGDLAGAVAMMRGAVAESPDDVELQVGLGTILIKQDPRECIAVLEKAGARVPVGKRSRIYAALAVSYDAVGKTELAIASARVALMLEPGRVGPTMLLARVLGEIGEHDESLALFNSLLDRVGPQMQATIEKAIAQLLAWRS